MPAMHIKRLCSECGDEFSPYQPTSTTCSKRCYAKSRNHLRRTPEARAKRRATRPSQAGDAYMFGYNLRKYGLTPEQYTEMLESQNGVCAICGDPPAGGNTSMSRLHVDHDHDTGKNRALLCGRCNTGLGQLREDVRILKNMIAYIEKHKEL